MNDTQNLTNGKSLKKARIEASNISELFPGSDPKLFSELGLVSPDGRIHRDNHRKLKQVFHLLELMGQQIEGDPYLKDKPTVIDLGSGKSTLGLLIREKWLKHNSNAKLILVESRFDLCHRLKTLVDELNIKNVEIINKTIANAAQDPSVGKPSPFLVCALHACDQATDEAIVFAVKNGGAHLFLAPCCQAELSRKLSTDLSGKICGDEFLVPLWRHSYHSREFGSHLTNVFRTLALEAMGYQVSVTEFVTQEHAVKNELIRAKFTGNKNLRSLAQYLGLKKKFGVSPSLLDPLILT